MGLSAQPRSGYIIDRRTDLIWFIGSSLAGWFYLALVWGLGRGLSHPLTDPFYTLSFFGRELPLTLGLVVVASWALLLDAPHLFATLARTFLDPDEWRQRRRELLVSLSWFLVGPLVVLAPYAAALVVPLSPAAMSLGAPVFFVFFRLWAYYHVARQHWGFVVLYQRKQEGGEDPVEQRADLWLFRAAMYLPLCAFLTAPWYGRTGLPPLGLEAEIAPGWSLAATLRPLCWALYASALVLYAAFQLQRSRLGRPRNLPKLLLLASIVPLHFAVFSLPLFALFVVPVITVGHNLQYHRIVWMYGRNKYLERPEPRYRFVRPLFRHPGLYALFGLVFTFALYRGPGVEAAGRWIGAWLDRVVLDGLAVAAGVARPGGLGAGADLVALVLVGWAMQHYYLDAKIWRVRSDRAVARALAVE